MARSSSSSPASKSFLLIAAALAIAALYFGRLIFIPLAFSVVLSFLLTPIVESLEKAHLGRVPSVLIVMIVGFALTAGMGWFVAKQLLEITGHVKDYTSNLEETIRSIRSPTKGAIGQAAATVRQLGRELASVPSPGSSDGTPASRTAHPVPVQVTPQPTNLVEEFRTLVGPLAGPVETTAIVVIFTAFVLINREDLRNRLIRLSGEGRLTLVTQALDDASRRLSRYLSMLFLVNASYGTVFGLGLHLMHIPHALLWGVLAGLLRFIPYIGTLIAAALPTLVGLIVFPGWAHALMIFGLFVCLEAVVANIIEPWLYGSHTGMSPFAVLVAAVFWALLWGPVGLILSTPLTVCILLAGRYVPQLSFLEVMLGDEPVLTPHEMFYQRLLAMDQEEARNVIEVQLRDRSLEDVYEAVLIPALRLAEEDRHLDVLGERASDFIYQSTRELIEDLGEKAQPTAVSAIPQAKTPKIICLPAWDDADELVAMMLAQILQRAGFNASHRSRSMKMLEELERERFQMACVSALPPFAVGQARALCRRLRARFPEMRVIVGLWDFAGGASKAEERVGANCANAVATNLSQAVFAVRKLLADDSADKPQIAPAPERHRDGTTRSFPTEAAGD